MVAGGFDADAAQQPEGGLVNGPDERVGDSAEPDHRTSDPQAGRKRSLNGQPFGRLLADGDVQEGNGREPDHKGNAMARMGRVDLEGIHERTQERGEDRLTDPAQSEAGDGDADLSRAQIAIEAVEHLPRGFGAALSLGDERLELGLSHLDQGELGQHKKSIEQHQRGDSQDFQDNGKWRIHAGMLRASVAKNLATFRAKCRECPSLLFGRFGRIHPGPFRKIEMACGCMKALPLKQTGPNFVTCWSQTLSSSHRLLHRRTREGCRSGFSWLPAFVSHFRESLRVPPNLGFRWVREER